MAALLQKSLTHRLLNPLLLLAALAGLAAAGLQVALQASISRQNLATEAQQLLQMLQPAARQLLLEPAGSDREHWPTLLAHPELHALHLSDAQQLPVSSLLRPLQQERHSWLPDLLLGNLHHASIELRDGGQALGTLSIALDTGIAGQQLLTHCWLAGLLSLTSLLLAALLQWLLAHRLVLRPLCELGQQLQHLKPGQPGNQLLPRPHEHEGDELGLWVDRTNQLLTTLSDSEHQRQAAEQRVTSLGRLDQLTGLPNRSLLQQQFAQLLHDSAHQQGRLAILCLDIDDFQAINERYGYDAGDHLLGLLAARLRSLDGRIGCLARLGSDQFALIQKHTRHPGDAADLASDLLQLLGEPFQIGPFSIHVNATIGIALYPDDGLQPDVLLQRAEQTMALAKQSARSHYRFYVASVDQQIRQQREMENDLRMALGKGELELHFQRQVSLGGLRTCGAEVLLRWRHPVRGLVMPDQFIPLAERSELITEISDWILQQACQQLQQWRAAGLDLRLAINLSPRQLRSQLLPGQVRSLLEQHGLPPHCLELEITETCLMEDIDSAARQLYSLRQTGVLLAIDDFGTGYSSLGYLKTLPLDKLKIDKSFITDLGSSDNDGSIVLAIMQLAGNLGMRVLAEGVETACQESCLQQLGCHEGQGYRYGRPLPAAEFEQQLRHAPQPERPAARLH